METSQFNSIAATDMSARMSILASVAACILLSVQIYGRLTGYDLGYSAIARGKVVQAGLFFAYLTLHLLVAAISFSRVTLSGRYTMASCALHVLVSGIITGCIVILACYWLDGALNDLARFIRFEVAHISRMGVPVLVLLSYLTSRALADAPRPMVETARWTKGMLAVIMGMLIIALIVYGWDKLRPWPEPMLEQLIIVVCGLVGPAFLLLVLAGTQRGAARVVSALGAISLAAIAAWL